MRAFSRDRLDRPAPRRSSLLAWTAADAVSAICEGKDIMKNGLGIAGLLLALFFHGSELIAGDADWRAVNSPPRCTCRELHSIGR